MKTKLIKVCAWCNRVKSNTGKWIVMGLGTDFRVFRGICPRCRKKQLRQAGRKVS